MSSTGTILRLAVLGYFLVVLGWTSGEDSGDWIRCAGCIVVCAGFLFVENVVPFESMCFTLAAVIWGFFIQPAILNHCHLTVWLLIFSAFRNLFVPDASTGWRFATMKDAIRLI
jgi:hypothetical protein